MDLIKTIIEKLSVAFNFSSTRVNSPVERHKTKTVINDSDIGPMQNAYRDIINVTLPRKHRELQKTLTEKKDWETEYGEFEKHPLFFKFQQVLASVHEHLGYINDDYVDIKAVAHAKNLIIFTKDKDTGLLGKRIELTDKGRFFADKYLEKHPLVPKISDYSDF